MHALVAILLLAAALCASLTMLIQQAVRYNAALERSSVSAPASRPGGASADNQTEPPESSAPATSESESPQSAQCGHAASGQCDPDVGRGGNTDATGNTDNDVGTDTGAGTADDVNPAPNATNGDGDAATSALIDLNTATSEQLQTVKGIGPVTAGRIIDHRTAIGRFTSVDQLLDVEGIGAKTLAKIRGSLTVR
ncbi:helix-hairpin-helix domain-containing protein [Bifidobacterium jacchi]|uniref:Helix-hairpin-helix domain-containing protein n=2 Tax=Bifidobacterium jacchi TaxID=2490545 RepID=A0A5N5RJ44_9BIFI|nr:helix-hairpin-helix domain-containing protein [Bifidobacterium jacchi]